ncbi:MAG: BMP family ABC transporter substrate-binding protein, partial [Wujia sp.]
MKKIRKNLCLSILLVCMFLLSSCSRSNTIDDDATNKGYEKATEAADSGKGIPKEDIKVGVLHISDPAEGSGYSYTHDIGIQGMQENLGLTDEQIVRKLNIDDGDVEAIEKAIQECVDEGCNVIFTTSWGYMEPTAEMAEKYPDVYFSHGTGYLSNGKNFNNYFGRIYQARYLSGIVAGMNTKTNKIGYVAAQDESSSEVTGGIDAFAMGVYSVNPDAVVYVKV